MSGKKMKQKGKISVFNIFVFTLFTIYIIGLFSVLFYGLYASLKSKFDFIDNPVSFPTWPCEFGNYTLVFKYFSVKVGSKSTDPTWYVEHMFAFSCLYAIGSALAMVLATSLVSYACAMFPCKVSSLLYGFVIFSMAFTVVGAQPAMLRMIMGLQIYDTFLGNWFMKFSFLNVYFLVLYEAFRGVSKEYREAAQLDGASELNIMLTIMFPLVRNIVGAVFVIQFISLWNDFNSPLLYLPSYPTLAYGLVRFTTGNNSLQGTSNEPVKLAASIVCVIPLLIFFVCFQKKLIGNLSGGIKG